ncbi:MAG: anthranilate synthase component 1 [Verrucomicrobiales bacterium]
MPETPIKPDYETFAAQFASGGLIPAYTELAADYETPLSAFKKINDGEYAFLLESAETREDAGRYSFLGSSPRFVFESREQEITLTNLREGTIEKSTANGDPLAELEKLMAAFRPVDSNGLPVFYGGAVGYLAYDAVRYFEPTVAEVPPDALGVPDMIFMLADDMLIFDHRHRRINVVSNIVTSDFKNAKEAYTAAREHIDALIEKLSQPMHAKPVITHATPVPVEPECNTTKEEYCSMVEKAKEYIRAGDIFQVVPSQRFSVDYTEPPIDLYRALRHVNPSPYMFCLQFPNGFSLVGSSPEVHVRAIDSKVEIRPLAGTRWRGKSEEEDLALEKDLLGDPKECAEHIMLVDLARNDVGRIAEYESVKVSDLMTIERYSHVMHIVTNVEGRLNPSKTAYDVMRATFPAGTVSGSPKVRAMQIINELEKNKRCAYSGAVGYFGFDGNLDSCIALRTCVLLDGKAYVQSGAGVVADSVPEKEYEETQNKAMGMIRAIERAKKLSEGT